MEALQNYKAYKKYEPDYTAWKQKQELIEAKRAAYLKAHPEAISQDDIKRGKFLLHAIDIMDEYSQKNAEDMEVATEAAAGQLLGIIDMAFLGLGMLSMNIPFVQKKIELMALKNPKMKGAISFIPMAAGLIAGIIAGFPIMSLAAKAQVSASRKGRFEAMRKDLQNPNSFAVLTDEQIEQAKKEAKDIKLDEKKSPLKNIKESIIRFKKMIFKDAEYEKQRAEFTQKLEEDKKSFDKPLTAKEIENAKRDKQILTKMVEKIDIASQDYAENVEMATNILTLISFTGGALTAWISSKALQMLKTKNKAVSFILPGVIGFALPLSISIFANKAQKQASRIGRFKLKQEMMNNPESLAYVSDEKTNEIKDIKMPEKKKQPNFFKFLIQVYKDNKEYNAHVKSKGVEEKKFHKAVENIKLSNEQLKDAKTLQQNTFRVFNKVDEKSQTYSESVEALSQGLQLPLSYLSLGLGAGLGYLIFRKNKGLDVIKNNFDAKKIAPKIYQALIGYVAGFLPLIGFEIYTTKEQKKASRIADMLAIKEMEDYRNFVDYPNQPLTQN